MIFVTSGRQIWGLLQAVWCKKRPRWLKDGILYQVSDGRVLLLGNADKDGVPTSSIDVNDIRSLERRADGGWTIEAK